MAWQDSRFSGGQRDGIAYSQSTDGGLTWSTPVQLNQAPAVQAFVPTVHIRDDGTIGVTYYDLRNNTTAPTILADYWLVQSADGVTWTETHVAGPIDYATAPDARGLFLGDYMGLTSIGTTFNTPNGKAVTRLEAPYLPVAAVQKTTDNFLSVSTDATARRIARRAVERDSR